MVAGLDLAHLEEGGVDGDHQVAGRGQVDAAADGRAVHRRDHGLGVALDALPGGDVPAAVGIDGLGIRLGGEAQVLAGAEDVAGAGQDGTAAGRVGLDLVEGGDQFLEGLEIVGVLGVGAIDDDPPDGALSVDPDVLGHGVSCRGRVHRVRRIISTEDTGQTSLSPV